MTCDECGRPSESSGGPCQACDVVLRAGCRVEHDCEGQSIADGLAAGYGDQGQWGE